MKNIWFTPEGYQKTSKKLQLECLKLLLDFSDVKGNVLDVGCGTGNALSIIDLEKINHYHGVDISLEMINYARSRYSNEKITLIVDDFLNNTDVNNYLFDTVICAACLHWFIPNDNEVIEKIYNLLNPGGVVFLSCAFNFDYLPGEKEMQNDILKIVRNKYKTINPSVLFDDFRFNITTFLEKFGGFNIKKSIRVEEKVKFDLYEDFRDWHLGSGSVLYQQFEKECCSIAVEEFYQSLYERYISGGHNVSYSTGLFLLEKR